MTSIFLLAGAPAVGKSTTARALAARFPKSIHIPVDDVRSMVVSGLVHPSADWSPALVEQLTLARAAVTRMALAYQNAGFTVTIDDFWDPNSRLCEYDLLMQQPDTHRILLCPSQQTAQARNQKRAGPGDGSAYIAEGIRAVYENLLKELPGLERQGWQVVDTTEKNIEETVTFTLAQIK